MKSLRLCACWCFGSLALATLMSGCHLSDASWMKHQNGSRSVKFSDDDKLLISYYLDGLPKTLAHSDATGHQIRLCFFDFRGGVLLDQDSEGVMQLPDHPGSFYSQKIKFGACISQPMPLVFAHEESRGQYAFDGQFYIDKDGGVNACVWAMAQSGVVDKVVLRCVLNKSAADSGWSVKVDSQSKYGKNLLFKSAGVDSECLILKYEMMLQDGGLFPVVAKLPLSNPDEKQGKQ